VPVNKTGLDRWLHWFDLSTSRACQSLQLESPITSLAVKGDGVTLAAGTAMGKTFLYDLRRAGPLTPLAALGQHTLHAVTSLHWQVRKVLTNRVYVMTALH
jgi:hypothetical protein